MRTRSAKPVPPPSAQPSPPSTVTPTISLPPEMIARIQLLAQDGESATERQKMRARFELVNKEWYNIVDYFTHVVVTKMSDLTRLTSKLRSSKVRALLTAKTKAITLNLARLRLVSEARRLCKLLKWLHNTETVVIEDIRGVWLNKDHRVGSFFVETLGLMRNLRHWTVPSHGSVAASTIEMLATKWSKLETIEIGWVPCDRGNADAGSAAGPFTPYHNMTSLSLTSLITWDSLGKLLVGLPNSLTTLGLTVVNAFAITANASVVIDQIGSIAGSLVEFSLVDRDYHYEEEYEEHLTFRGLLDGLVSQLTAVERLSIPAYGLSNLATLLAPLPNLTRLKITECRTCLPESKPEELHNLIRTSASLKSLSVDKNVRYCGSGGFTWTDHQIADIESEATRNSVDLVWV